MRSFWTDRIAKAGAEFLRDERGGNSIEYALILAGVALICIPAFNLLGGSSGGNWGAMANKANTAMSK